MNKISESELRTIQLRILNNVHDYCKNNNINYYLFGGTLIGAVRHKGYIPWDDDIDIAMKRSDYDRFIKNYKDENYQVVSIQKTKKYYLPFAKVIDTRTILKENISAKTEIGVNIDIFPLDNISDDAKYANRQYRKAKIYHNLLTMKNVSYKKRSFKKQCAYLVGKMITLPLTRKMLIKKIEANASQYKNKNTRAIGQIVLPIYNKKTIWPSRLWDKPILGEFEGKKYYIPKEYDKILTINYGDYMKLPPKEKRIAHHDFTAWMK